MNLTVARLGREAWRATVKDQARLVSSETSRPTRSAPLITLQQLKNLQQRERRLASPGELRRAEALGDLIPASVCEQCDGARYVGHVVSPGALPVAVPCVCMPRAARAAFAGIDARFEGATIETFKALGGKAEARAFAERWDCERSVVLTGAVGRGKTHLGCALLFRALDRFMPARFVGVADFMDELKARFDGDAKEQSQAYFDRILATHVLMLDDLGAEQETDWTRERVGTAIDRRYRSKLPAIVTTNLGHDDIARRYGPRIADRLREYQWISIGGASVRGTAVTA